MAKSKTQRMVQRMPHLLTKQNSQGLKDLLLKYVNQLTYQNAVQFNVVWTRRFLNPICIQLQSQFTSHCQGFLKFCFRKNKKEANVGLGNLTNDTC